MASLSLFKVSIIIIETERDCLSMIINIEHGTEF